jgi:hypothetical protein
MSWLEDFNQDIFNSFDLTDTLLHHESFGLLRVTGHYGCNREMLFVESIDNGEEDISIHTGIIDMGEDGDIEIITLIKKPIDQENDTVLYIGAPTGQKAKEAKKLGWGAMLTPDMFRNSAHNELFAMDNGVFAEFKKNPAKEFEGKKFIHYLDRLLEKNAYPDFVVIPDKIGADPLDSLALSLSWVERLRKYPFPLYFVVQDGMTPEMLDEYNIPNLVDGIFVGGKPTFNGFGEASSDEVEWKLQTGEMWVKYAHKHRIRTHIGRVSSIRRYQWARSIGADSCDTSQPVFSNAMWNGFIRAKKQAVFNLAA